MAAPGGGCYHCPHMGLIRTIVSLTLLGGLIYLGATVELGNHTFFGHVQRIWKADETRDLVDGVEKKSGPVLEKVKRGVEAGYREATTDDDATVEPPPAEAPTGG
jgi:hypothetical protein